MVNTELSAFSRLLMTKVAAVTFEGGNREEEEEEKVPECREQSKMIIYMDWTEWRACQSGSGEKKQGSPTPQSSGELFVRK